MVYEDQEFVGELLTLTSQPQVCVCVCVCMCVCVCVCVYVCVCVCVIVTGYARIATQQWQTHVCYTHQGHGLALVYNEMLQTNGGQHLMYTEEPMKQSAPFLVGKTYSRLSFSKVPALET